MSVKSICGVILVANDVEALAAFYRAGLGLDFEREDHGGLDVHFGLDVGEVHFAIHPAANFGDGPPTRSAVVAFQVDAIDDHLAGLLDRGATVVTPRHDEGFGDVITLRDPAGNLLELVELSHEWGQPHPH